MHQQLTEEEVKNQSLAAFAQSGEKWKKHAKINGELFKERGIKHKDLVFEGYGKCLVIIGMGQSLENEIETLKKYNDRDDIEIACCDKAFKIMVDNGIKVKWVFLADAIVDYEKWVKPVIHKTKDTTLVSSICANPEWITNWLGPLSFYVNKDNIKSEKIFMKISGCTDLIPASSNVGNTSVVFATNILGYSEYLLVGYDYGWTAEKNYYAYENPNKRYWMKSNSGFDIGNNIAHSSSNLMFSCRWLQDYYRGPLSANGVKMFNCSGSGFLQIPKHNLDRRLSKFEHKKITGEIVRKKKLVNSETKVFDKENCNEEELQAILANKDVLNIQVTYCDKKGNIAWI